MKQTLFLHQKFEMKHFSGEKEKVNCNWKSLSRSKVRRSFKATYEEVVDTHLPQCKFIPLDCPNRCGATFEQDFLEDHMKMCRLEEVECELRDVGCGGRFLREDQEEHARQNSQKHLTLTASLAVETKEQLQQLELDQRHKEKEEKLKNKRGTRGAIGGTQEKYGDTRRKVYENANGTREKLEEQYITTQSEKEFGVELQRELQKKNFPGL